MPLHPWSKRRYSGAPLTSPSGNEQNSNANSSKDTNEGEQKSPELVVRIPPYDENAFEAEFESDTAKNSDRKHKWSEKLKPHCTWKACWKNLKVIFPIIEWLPKYQWKNWLLQDVAAGITVGTMNVPQGMAYGILTGLSAVYGLYTSLFPPLCYAIFGTSRHVSMGAFAIISLMVGTALSNIAGGSGGGGGGETSGGSGNSSSGNSSNSTNSSQSGSGGGSSGGSGGDEELVAASAMLTILVGLIMCLCALLRLGFIASYLSDQLIEGVTTGASIQVLSSQVKDLFGLKKLPSTSGPFALFKFYVAFFGKISNTNLVTLGMAAVAMVLLIINRSLTPWIRSKLKVPLPMELLVVISATLASYKLRLDEEYDVSIVGPIPLGIPSPKFPSFNLEKFSKMLPDAILLAVVSYSLTISTGKLFAKKDHYTVSANQEWLANGVVNVFSGIFQCHCAGTSLSRSAVLYNQGAKTQLAGFVASMLILLVLLVLAQLVTSLPKCILAAIIFVAMISMLKQFKTLPRLWRQSKVDFFIWLVACVAIIVLDMAFGLMVAVVFALACVIYRSQRPSCGLLGRVDDTTQYKALHNQNNVQEIENTKIFRFDAPLYYANVDYFKGRLFKTTVDPSKFREQCIALRKERGADERSKRPETIPRYIIIDCSMMPYVDVQGLQCLMEIYEEYSKIGVYVFFASCKRNVRTMFHKVGFFDKVPKWTMFVGVQNAVETAEANETELSKRSMY